MKHLGSLFTLKWQRRYAAVSIGIMLIWLLCGQAGWYSFMQLKLHIRHVQAQINGLAKERAALIRHTRRFLKDATMKERIARERLLLGYPDELIYIVKK